MNVNAAKAVININSKGDEIIKKGLLSPSSLGLEGAEKQQTQRDYKHDRSRL